MGKVASEFVVEHAPHQAEFAGVVGQLLAVEIEVDLLLAQRYIQRRRLIDCAHPDRLRVLVSEGNFSQLCEPGSIRGAYP